MDPIAHFIERHTAEQRRLMLQLRELILQAAPAIEESLKWKIPFYAHQGLLCYLNPTPGGICLGFCRGALLSNAGGLLTGEGKEVRLLHLTSDTPLPLDAIRQLLQEALLLNETMQRRKNYYV
ncbi:DUF1801 domain-containing protein [Cesiribacter andamanensis]|uniref:YdhG-like domain-containing protein n=1 Tax=Cesiribacter andamanensis AMV16 TaxID=1279009 RepID=M7N840_9BACT|nr:DUF1801 domain-containing protein [Cesiribacter andamanensis]EMR03427.1 hypothetical protein ADICEAN_01449 [Cesiribacter andamanensis AMV16]